MRGMCNAAEAKSTVTGAWRDVAARASSEVADSKEHFGECGLSNDVTRPASLFL